MSRTDLRLTAGPAMALLAVPLVMLAAAGCSQSPPSQESSQSTLKIAAQLQIDGNGAVAGKYQWTDKGELTTTLIWIYKIQ